MDYSDWQRAAALYFPLVATVIARLLTGAYPRQFVACLLCFSWSIPALLVLQRLNQSAGWWLFPTSSIAELRGMPLELFLGWAILWGLLPHVVCPRWPIVWAAAALVAIDAILMPLLAPVVTLNRSWLIGEGVAVGIVLLPSLCLGRWTAQRINLRARALLQIVMAALLILFFIPEVIFALRPTAAWAPLFVLPSWLRQLALQFIFLLAVPGVSAVLEFADRGEGTPIPYDPPRRLVTSGIYRYCANPMQLSCVLVTLAWACLLANKWLLWLPIVSIVYSAGIAEWDEKEDLNRRFGQPWRGYRASVKAWWPRWYPYHAGPPAIIYIARTCGPCREVRAWLESRLHAGLRIVDAESLPAHSILRIRYDPADGSPTVEGIRAIGRALEHINLAWAFLGCVIRLPILSSILQLFTDATGLGHANPLAEPLSRK